MFSFGINANFSTMAIKFTNAFCLSVNPYGVFIFQILVPSIDVARSYSIYSSNWSMYCVCYFRLVNFCCALYVIFHTIVQSFGVMFPFSASPSCRSMRYFHFLYFHRVERCCVYISYIFVPSIDDELFSFSPFSSSRLISFVRFLETCPVGRCVFICFIIVRSIVRCFPFQSLLAVDRCDLDIFYILVQSKDVMMILYIIV